MTDFNALQALFPCAMSEVNYGALDINFENIIAHATGSILHLSFIENSVIKKAYPYVIGNHPISSIKFHPKKRLIAVGNAANQLFLFDIDERKILAESKFTRDQGIIKKIEWCESVIVYLSSTRKLAAVVDSTPNGRDRRVLTPLWEYFFNSDFSSFSIDGFQHNTIAVYGMDAGIFYLSTSSIRTKPVPIWKSTQIEGVKHVEWSLHLPDYLVVLTTSGLFLISPIYASSIQISNGGISHFLQSFSDYRKLFVFEVNGAITEYAIDNMSLEKKSSISGTGKATNVCVSPFRDDLFVVLYAPYFMAMFHTEPLKVTSVYQLRASSIRSFDTDGMVYVYGQEDGSVIYGILSDPDKELIFRVSHNPILFISISPATNKVYWHDIEDIGEIDLVARQISRYRRRHTPVTKAVGSFQGGLLVQRGHNYLGVYIDNREHPVIFDSDIVTFAFNEVEASLFAGSFCVALEDREIQFRKYTTEGVQLPFLRLRSYESVGTPVSMAWWGNSYAVGSMQGSVSILDLRQQDMVTRTAGQGPITYLKFHEGIIYGICGGSIFYDLEGLEKVDAYTTKVVPFSISMVLSLSSDGVLGFVNLPVGDMLAEKSRALPLPSQSSLAAEAILSHPQNDPEKAKRVVGIMESFDNQLEDFNDDFIIIGHETKVSPSLLKEKGLYYFSFEGREIWMHLMGRTSMRQMFISGLGNSSQFNIFSSQIIESLNSNIENFTQCVYNSMVYANKLKEAAEYLMRSNSSAKEYFPTSVLGLLTLCLDEERSDEVKNHVTRISSVLMNSGKLDEGCLLMKIARLDKEAIKTLIDMDQFSYAIRFLRMCDDTDYKASMLKRIGASLMQNGKFRESIFFFLGAGEFHPVLFALFSIGEISDCFFIKQYVQSKGMLNEYDPEELCTLDDLLPLSELLPLVDSEFRSKLISLSIDPSLCF